MWKSRECSLQRDGSVLFEKTLHRRENDSERKPPELWNGLCKREKIIPLTIFIKRCLTISRTENSDNFYFDGHTCMYDTFFIFSFRTQFYVCTI